MTRGPKVSPEGSNRTRSHPGKDGGPPTRPLRLILVMDRPLSSTTEGLGCRHRPGSWSGSGRIESWVRSRELTTGRRRGTTNVYVVSQVGQGVSGLVPLSVPLFPSRLPHWTLGPTLTWSGHLISRQSVRSKVSPVSGHDSTHGLHSQGWVPPLLVGVGGSSKSDTALSWVVAPCVSL